MQVRQAAEAEMIQVDNLWLHGSFGEELVGFNPLKSNLLVEQANRLIAEIEGRTKDEKAWVISINAENQSQP